MKSFLCVSIGILFCHALSTDPCEDNRTCSACIRDPNLCVWCATEEIRNKSRCMSQTSDLLKSCPDEIINVTSSILIEKNLDFDSVLGEVVQIKPQKINMKLRPGETVDFSFSFKAAPNYPVDMYFLLDASLSMNKIRSDIAKQTEELYRLMYALTNNVFLGLGTFVDKNLIPFTNAKNSTMTYSFRHEVTLCDDYETFKKRTIDINFGSNYDEQEGVLDALAQVIVCKHVVGWRNESRKIVVLMTNGLYHAAGHTKWAGIIQPYDGKCYTENNTYTKELEMDYPSIGIIDKLASDEEVIVIFAIDQLGDKYDLLSKAINGAQLLNYDVSTSKSIVSKLSKLYKDISRKITFKVNIPSEVKNEIKLSFSPDCSEDNAECNVQHDAEKTIMGKIQLLQYIETDDLKIDIALQGIKEKLTLDIEIIKECDCKESDNTPCKNGGTRKCGICECLPDTYGDNCECNSTSVASNQDITKCMPPNSTVECNGHGSCICGTCVCGDGYKGDLCDCTTKCPRHNDKVCGGRGNCNCGVCVCHRGWSSDTCSCDDSKDLCTTDVNIVCFDYGDCSCTKCVCPPTCEWDARSSQDILCRPLPCPECHSRQCNLLEPFALTQVNGSPCNGRVNVTSVESLTVGNETGWHLCPNIRADVGCYTNFLYKYGENKYDIQVLVQNSLDCAISYYIYGGSCLAAIIVIGIITLAVWKVYTLLHDHREYKRFVKEQGMEYMVTLNPLFNPSVTTFNNPSFRKRSIFYNE